MWTVCWVDRTEQNARQIKQRHLSCYEARLSPKCDQPWKHHLIMKWNFCHCRCHSHFRYPRAALCTISTFYLPFLFFHETLKFITYNSPSAGFEDTIYRFEEVSQNGQTNDRWKSDIWVDKVKIHADTATRNYLIVCLLFLLFFSH